MEDKLILYMHAGSGNHGCEAIVNSLCRMMRNKAVLVSYRAEEDEAYSLRELCGLIQERSFEMHKLAHVAYYLYRRLTGDEESFIRYRYGQIFKRKKLSMAVSIGGDNYCYDNMLNDLRLANRAFLKKGAKTVLLGCSIEPELLKRKEILEDLLRYHTIIARESITYEALLEAFGEREKKPRLCLYPDPAFTLPEKRLPLPEGFAEKNTVGINLSPLIQASEKKPGITMECYEALIEEILEKTDMQLALIPHVVWKQSDDRLPLHALYEKYKKTGRVVEITDASCEELKGFISRCRMFVGARTHATIAAYSSLVPTLVVGYSVKAAGIARDLFGTEENYVIPVQSLEKREDLAEGFWRLMDREEDIRKQLALKMPAYKEQALMTGKEADRLWEEFSRQQKI